MRKRKRVFRFYTIADFEREETFLREQHKQGYKFVRFILPGFYVFEECEPEDVVYQLDFTGCKDIEKSEYLQIFTDCGWEYLCDVSGWSYFRKPVSAEDQNFSIFSDTESKIAMLDKVYKWRMLPLLCIFLCVVVPQCVMTFTHWSNGGFESRGLEFVLFLFFVVMFLLYIYVLVPFALKLAEMKRKYGYDK